MSRELTREWHVARVAVREGGEVGEGVRVVRVMVERKIIVR